jgi:hypothetical protein
MGIGVFCDAKFGDRGQWETFALAHFLRHETIRQSIGTAGTVAITQAKIDNITVDDLNWMLDHAQEHLDICNALALQASPYVAECDLTDSSQYANWMYFHKNEHDAFDQALGIL